MSGRDTWMAHPEFALILLIVFVTTPTLAKDFWNINCGGNGSLVSARNLTFEGDAPYIKTGVSREAPDAASNGIPREIATLRAFPAAPWKKSCYRVPVVPGTKVQVRAQFYYGNYDGLSSPPSFMATFGSTESCNVTLTSTLDVWSSCEVVYTAETQGTDICFVRTNVDQSPVVSTIEVWQLPTNMYELLDFSSYTLFSVRRFAFGANETIGYPDDAYNRNWEPNDLQGVEAGRYKPEILKSENGTAVDSKWFGDSPPSLLFQVAAVAPMVDNKTAANLTIRTPWLASDPGYIYWTLYFTDPIASNGTSARNQRKFDVYMDGELLNNISDPIQPTHGHALEFYGSMYKASNETVFDLVRANGSTLPPAISGMEIYLITDMVNATSSQDVEALSTMQGSFTGLQNWTGDPCLPVDYNWEWVGCKYPDKSPPRINKLLLSSYQLSGDIPDFSTLDALEVIDLSNNSFTGSVPEFFASLSYLQKLDLSNNDFDSIPSSLLDNKNIQLITIGNPKLQTDTPPPSPPGPSEAASTSGGMSARIFKLVLFALTLAADAMV